jgi:hypothetical protein
LKTNVNESRETPPMQCILEEEWRVYLPWPPLCCCPDPRALAGIGYGNGAYGSVYEGLLDPEVAPAVEVLPGEEEAEDIAAVVAVGVSVGVD